MKSIPRVRAILAFAAISGLALTSCQDAETPEPDTPVVRELRLLQPFPDRSEQGPFAGPRPTLHDALSQIWDATDDENVKGLLVRVGVLEGTWGSVEDLIEALREFRSGSREIHCHFETADNVGYLLLASACDRVTMTPAGTLNLVGPAAVMLYARSFLEKVGIEAEILHMGRYKGAGDTLIRDDMPPEAKESMDAILDDLYGALVEATATRTKDDQAAAKGLIDEGPYTSEAAMKAGLIDEVAYLRDVREAVKVAVGATEIRKTTFLPVASKLTLGDFLDLLSGEGEKPEREDQRVAVAFVTGNIVDGEGARPGEAVSGPVVRALDRFAKDDNVKAVVLRINSPGGSALASDRMWEAVRNLAESKPVIASIGDVAASGGYYIASAADEVLAHPNSLVGSIGVVGGKLNAKALTEDAGINTFVLQRGARAAWSTPVRGLTPSEREAFEGLLKSTYDRFIDRVAEGRKMERDAVLAAAEGRVMTADDGAPLGLVDEMAGFGSAIERARKAGGLGDDAPVELWPASRGVLDSINELFGGGGDDARRLEKMLLGAHPLFDTLPFGEWLRITRTLAYEHVALVSPYVFSIR
jgi:protease-4